jgi:hypothetical protein
MAPQTAEENGQMGEVRPDAKTLVDFGLAEAIEWNQKNGPIWGH